VRHCSGSLAAALGSLANAFGVFTPRYVAAPMLFGEMELIKGQGVKRRLHTAIAESNIVACAIPKHVFRALVLSDVRLRGRGAACLRLELVALSCHH